jgi:hypothetical protein
MINVGEIYDASFAFLEAGVEGLGEKLAPVAEQLLVNNERFGLPTDSDCDEIDSEYP